MRRSQVLQRTSTMAKLAEPAKPISWVPRSVRADHGGDLRDIGGRKVFSLGLLFYCLSHPSSSSASSPAASSPTGASASLDYPPASLLPPHRVRQYAGEEGHPARAVLQSLLCRGLIAMPPLLDDGQLD
uniref:Uncharacterized protein n=1 Tax=Corethron hystrix TaxID=216773 RepID=A0A7S1BSU3_9STRA|mmetsp:Transcript_38185/g.88863  ORF Transcript_38185/g.88863 Transcript_38185/m.88863 type:complete len:129 (+) Transcript_38185:130-516(+)